MAKIDCDAKLKFSSDNSLIVRRGCVTEQSVGRDDDQCAYAFVVLWHRIAKNMFIDAAIVRHYLFFKNSKFYAVLTEKCLFHFKIDTFYFVIFRSSLSSTFGRQHCQPMAVIHIMHACLRICLMFQFVADTFLHAIRTHFLFVQSFNIVPTVRFII